MIHSVVLRLLTCSSLPLWSFLFCAKFLCINVRQANAVIVGDNRRRGCYSDGSVGVTLVVWQIRSKNCEQ